jgi:uncharacterized protein
LAFFLGIIMPAPSDSVTFVDPVTFVDSVTFVIYHHVSAANRVDYEAWVSRAIPVAQGFRGYMGVSVIRPVGNADLYTLALRFAQADDLRSWIESDERKRLLSEAEPLLQHKRSEVQSGVDFWYTPPEPGARHPVRWKQYLLVLLIIFPLTLVVPQLWQLAFGTVSWMNLSLVRHFGVTASVVFLMVYLILPLAMRRLGRWLVS